MKRASFHVVAAIVLCLVAPVCAGGSTVTGVVASHESGSPAIAGALIRTEGEPGYSTTSGSDGSYSLTVPTGSCNLLVFAAGHVPQRLVTTVAGGTLTAGFLLGAAPATASVTSLPAPLDWGEPPSAPSAPGDELPVSFAQMGSLPATGTPRIAGWNDQLEPDESFTLTGADFTTRSGVDAGTDTIVWVWARMSSGVGVLRQVRLWKVTSDTILGTLPDDIPFGMYLIWVENSEGAGSPVCVNRTTPTWVGPLGNTVPAGGKKRVFGRNMSHNRGKTTSDSFVYIEPAAGGAFITCPVNTVNPYMVEFTVPLGTPSGNYDLYVHNGHGGAYGWGDPLSITVAPDWVRGATTVNLVPGGTDDTATIQNAINTLTALPNGGTVTLSGGSFIIRDTIDLKSNVELKGSGMASTTVLVRLSAPRSYGVGYSGDHSALSDLTIETCSASAIPTTDVGAIYPSSPKYAKYTNVKVIGDAGTTEYNNIAPGSYAEITGCEFYRQFYTDGNCWVHNNTLYGGFYAYTEASVYMRSWYDVFENNHVETAVWPVNPANGSLNYIKPDGSLANWITWDPTLRWMTWAKRVALASCSFSYIAGTTSNNVAVQDNRGEMILFHGYPCQWYGNVLSTSGLTLNLRTDGLVNGQAVTIANYGDSNLGGLVGGSPVPDARPSYWPLDGNWAIVISGKGLGQARQIVSHTSKSVTIDKPWRIQPDATSTIVVSYMYVGNTVYNNDLNAFPPGYVQQYSASTGVDIDGNGWQNSVEGNTSRRTYGGRSILANSGGVSYWNVMRGETAIDCFHGGLGAFFWDNNPSGPVLLGNAFRDCTVNVYGGTTGGVTSGWGEGTVIERTAVTAKLGYNLTGVSGSGVLGSTPPAWPDGSSIYRKGSITAIDATGDPTTREPVYIGATDSKLMLIGNSYSGSAQNYFLATGLSSYGLPMPLYRLAKFTGYLGQPVADVLIPVANAGIAAMSWTVTASDPWINPSIQANGNVAGESDMGRLAIAVDTTGMSAGEHWGYVTVSNGSSSARVGVVVDLDSGAPTNASPGAVFTATPTGGAMPLATTFDASSSFDSDGSIASYYWDFGDGSYGSGVTASHTYSSEGTYTPVLTVMDNSGATDAAWTNITVSPALTGVNLVGSPGAPISSGTPVTLSASATGGYQVQYKFLINSGSGWTTFRDYQTTSTCAWTPTNSAIHQIQVYARNTGSINDYDLMSRVLSYPVGLIPSSGLKLWLKADAGVTSQGGAVSAWADQSGAGNTVSQSTPAYMPSLVDNVINGRPVVRFANGSQGLQSAGLVLSGNTSFTTFASFKYNSLPASTYQYVWFDGSDTSTGGYGIYMTTIQKFRAAWGASNNAVMNANSSVTGTWYRAASSYDGANNRMWINGGYIGSAAKTDSNLSGLAFSVGNLASGSTKGLYGDVSEILVYNRALSDSERAGVDAYLSARWNPQITVIVDRIADAAALPDNTQIALVSPKSVTVAPSTFTDGSYYVEEPDRTRGIKVLGGAASLWDSMTLTGTVTTDANGERVITGASITSRVSGSAIGPLGTTNRGITAIGILTRAWGKVTSVGSGSFVLDDGSANPITVRTDLLVSPPTVTIQPGNYVAVTGLAGKGTEGVVVIRPRGNSDIQVY